MTGPSLEPLPEAEAEGEAIDLTMSQRLRVEQIAGEFAVLLGGSPQPRFTRAAYRMLQAFVWQGNMTVEQAIELLGAAIATTELKLSRREVQH
jgi:hypothetical protein